MLDKILHRKLKFSNTNPTKNRGSTWVFRKGKQFLLPYSGTHHVTLIKIPVKSHEYDKRTYL